MPEQNSLSQVASFLSEPAARASLSILAPAVGALLLTACIMPFYIAALKKLQINQFLREEGPKSHSHKAKTPTMGGLVFIITTVLSVACAALLAPRYDVACVVMIVVGALCGFVGLVDDSAKVIQKANKGISGFIRLGIETCFGGLLGIYLVSIGKGALVLPAFIGGAVHVGAYEAAPAFFCLALPAVVIVLLGAFLTAATTNAVNLHDGMDGLAAGTACQVFATLSVLLYETGQSGYATISATAAGALLGFLLYNRNPAQIFMGDTGSLFIGGLMACLVLGGGLTLWFVPLSLIYIVEALSVMIQVVIFKLTKPFTPEKPMSSLAIIKHKLTKKVPGEGKRVFRMAPLHHHFEAVLSEKGWAEWQVVAAFWAVQFVLCLAVLAAFESFRSGLPCGLFH